MEKEKAKNKVLKRSLQSLAFALGLSVVASTIYPNFTNEPDEDKRIEYNDDDHSIDIETEESTHEHNHEEVSDNNNEEQNNIESTQEHSDDKNNNNQNDTNTPDDKEKDNNQNNKNNSDNNKTNEESKLHIHKYNNWKYYDDNYEVATCEECGKEKTRKHKLGKNLRTEYITNNNGTHKVIQYRNCDNCEYVSEKIFDKDCSMSSWSYNPSTKQEERTCNECGYKEVRTHVHDQTPSNLVYTLDKTNNNGTHRLKAEYSCGVCKETFKLHKDVNCNLSSWSYNPSTKQEERTCGECGYKVTRVHTHDQAPSNLVYTLDKKNNDGTHKLKATYTCSVCNETITLYKTENCKLSSWSYNPTTKQEERICSTCGYKETKVHTHDQAPSNLVYTLDKTNNDGTHKLKATYTCSVCKETITLYKTENCKLSSWTYNPTTKQEERVCTCGYKETKVHVHEQAPSNLVYTLDKSNDDGTHKLKATYTCSVCRETITLYKTENCNYGSWEQNNGFTCSKECTVCGHDETKNHSFQVKPNSVTSNATVGLHNVVEKCSDCGYEKQVQVNCTGDGDKYFYQNGNVITEREDCAVCGDVCIQDPHNHTYGNYVSVNDDNHKRTCACGNESTEAHSYSAWSVTGDGTNSRTCSSCNHTQSVTHTCTITSRDEYPSTKTKDYCYETVSECTQDGCNIESRTKVSHNYHADVTDFCAVYTCYNCGYSYSEDYLAMMSLSFDEVDMYKEEETDTKKLVLK